jgi:acyl-CoA reductase-like NAD-dependent aldehyde dehydrogenase
VGSVEATLPAEIPAVVDRARKAFAHWSGLSLEDRRRHLTAFKRQVMTRGEEIAAVVAAESGKTLVDAYSFDVLTALTVIDHYIRNSARYLRPRRGRSWPFLTVKGWTEFHPRGVAAIISPWNYPFFLAMIPTISALAAGCAVVLKPSELTSLTGRIFSELAEGAGLPTDLLQVVFGGAEVGAALIAAEVNIVSFTGSTRVGKQVAAAAAQRLIPAILELGGKDPMVVLEDADLDRAARGAVFGAMVNAGQTCVSVERCYVVDDVYEEFLGQLERAFDSVGAATAEKWEIGPIITPGQMAVIEEQLREAVAQGAKVLRGGERRESPGGGLYFQPTLLVDVDHTMRVMQDETFGPILPVMRVANAEAALAAANDTRYGLHGSVWTSDRSRGARFASQMRSGTVAVNDVAVNFITPNLAFGGIGDSGFGSNFGPEGLRAYCYPKSITSSRLRWPTTQLLGAWYPHRRPLAYWKALARVLFR